MNTQRVTQGYNSERLTDKQLQPGTILVNRYAIQEIVGMGGMGSVYRARDLHFPNAVKLVAVKEMINQALDPVVRQTIVANFEREATLLATLDHPSIPRIFDYFTQNERSYLVLEFVHGKDLEEVLSQAQENIPEENVIQWAIELCDVLNYLHTRTPEPIIFRDMKPSNVMINTNSHVVLVDFGIAKIFRDGQKGTMIGTEGYSPPEQYRGEATQRADIYALGATLHHVLTRKDPRLEPPFTFFDRPIRKINPAVSPELELVVNTALQYSADQRFPSAQAMKEELIAAGRKTGLLSRVKTPVESRLDDAPRPLWTFLCEDEIRATPAYDKGRIYVGSYDHNVYALDAETGKLLWKFASDGAIVSRPAVSDGEVVFGSHDRRLYGISADTRQVLLSFLADAAIRTSPVVAEGHVFFGADDGMLYMLNLTSGRMAWRFDAGSPIRSSPVVANDQIFFGTDEGDFFCLTLNGQAKWRSKAKRSILCSPAFAKGSVFYTSLDSMLYALDARTGWITWKFRMGKGSVSSPCVVENMVIAGAADNMLYSLDTASARENWRFRMEHQVSGSPLIHKDSVYCGAADGSLYCLEYRTGRLRWRYTTGGPITSAPIVYNDVLYFGSADRMLYALKA